MGERRHHPRLEDKRRVSCALIPERPEPGEGLRTLSAEAKELARDGIQIRTFTPILENSFVRVDVPAIGHSSRKAFSLSGIVRWCKRLPGEDRYSAGIEFMDFADEDRQQWVEYVQTLFT